MSTTSRVLFERFSPTADLTVVAVCIVMVILMLFAYVRRERTLRIFLGTVGMIVFSACVDVSWNMLIRLGDPSLYSWAYTIRIVYHSTLFGTFCLYAFYYTEVTGVSRLQQRIIVSSFCGIAVVLLAVDILLQFTPSRFEVLENGDIRQGFPLTIVGCTIFSLAIVYLLFHVRNYLYRRVMYGLFCSVGISFVMQAIQQVFGYTSFTVAAFMFPLIAMFYTIHSIPYNVKMGAVDVQAMHDMVSTMYQRKTEFIFLSLYMPELDAEGASLPEAMQGEVRRFTSNYFRGAYLFQIHNGHMLLLVRKQLNPDYEDRIARILAAFRVEYARFGYTYKIVIGESVDSVSGQNEYAGLIRSVHRKMKENTVYRVEPADIELYNRDLYILQELADIHAKKDPEDPRVVVLSQPVLNIATGLYDTAEALMRLELEKTGTVFPVFPDQFISLAEEAGYIHTLTEIILHKTCLAIREMLREGYMIDRVSVNVSVLELRDEAFCGDIMRVIRRNGVSPDRIALELTESRSERDFYLVRDKFRELREQGIKVYLDDFGTGYTNLERIVTLPFDIIKFDRSMVEASRTDTRAELLLQNMAATFTDMGYTILFEGVENEADEKRCKGMSAAYLQGYRYSRPVPIEQLRDFFPKSE